MSEENLNTPEAVPDASDVSATEGQGAEASVPLSKLGEVLGKEFNDADTALKSIKDTYNYVGGQADFKEKMSSLTEKLGTDESGVLSALEALTNSAKPEETPKTPSGDFVSRDQYAQDQFFSSNPELNDLKDVLVPLKGSQQDMSWSDFVKQPHIEQLVSNQKTASELQSKRSVVESNPRIGAATDKMTEARKAQQDGNSEAAKSNAVGAVLDILKE